MTIKLLVSPEEAHTSLAHFADLSAALQSRLGQLRDEEGPYKAAAGELAAWHERGLFLLQYVLAAGSHAVELRQCLTVPGSEEVFKQFESKVVETMRGEIQLLKRLGLHELRNQALNTVAAALKIVQLSLAAVEELPATRKLRPSSNKVFFSWQKSLPNATNRGLIETALVNAIEKLGDVQVDETLDRDTVDVAGAPDIVSTILDKIDNAAVFVADVSIVTPTGFEKPCPNPNVLLELGYALRALGPSRVILVANEHYGNVDTLPFDLRSRRVICYRAAPEETDRATPRRKLATVFEEGIRQSLSVAHAEAPQNEIRIKLARAQWGTFTNVAGTKVLTASVENHSSMPLFIASVGFEFAPMDGLMQEKDVTGKINSAAKVEPGDSYQWLTDLRGLLEFEDRHGRKLWSFTVHTRIGHVLRSSPGELQRVLHEARATR